MTEDLCASVPLCRCGVHHPRRHSTRAAADSWTWQNNFIYTALANAIFTGDHLDVDPGGASLIPHRKLNADFLITYLLYPGTAMYLGYNTNYANADPFSTELENDHRQLFIKISYLVRF